MEYPDAFVQRGPGRWFGVLIAEGAPKLTSRTVSIK